MTVYLCIFSCFFSSNLTYSSKLDNILEPFHVCPRHRVEGCERPHLLCVIWNFSHCFEEHEMNHDKPMYQKAESAAEDCFEKLESVMGLPRLWKILYRWYVLHIKS